MAQLKSALQIKKPGWWLAFAVAVCLLSGCGRVPGGMLKGRVTFNGKGVDRGAVQMFNIDDEWIRNPPSHIVGAGTDAKGYFTVEGIPPGKYEIVVTAREFRYEEFYKNPKFMVDIPANKTLTHNIELP